MKKRLAATETPNYYGVALRYLFRKAGRGSQKELAEKLQVSTAHLQRIQTGVTTGSVIARNAIAEALGTTQEEMIALGRKLIEQEGDFSQPAPALPGRKACLSADAVSWWPDIVRYIEMVNLAAQGDDPELFFDVVEALIREATAKVAAARKKFKAEQGGDEGLGDVDNSKQSDGKISAKGAGGGR